MRILAIDDDPVFLELLAGMLRMIGYAQVTTMPSGMEALHELDFSGTLYDCILSDMQMPDMDGVAAAREIRALGGRYASLPIVAVTANAMADDRERCRAAGMDDHVAKPIDANALAAALRRAADGRLGGGDAGVRQRSTEPVSAAR